MHFHDNSLFPFMLAAFLHVSHRETFFPQDNIPMFSITKSSPNHEDVNLKSQEQVLVKFYRQCRSMIGLVFVFILQHLSFMITFISKPLIRRKTCLASSEN